MALLGFLLTIGILVVIHEFGHYLFARLFKVKVLTFSIGFGPKIISWQGKNNQWKIGAIPLGGYVQMLDEREAPVAPEFKHLAFNNKPPFQKLLIAFAGPLFNILFAFIAYYFIGLYGVYNLKPVISTINPTPLVQNLEKITPNSTIIKIDNQQIDSWSEAEEIFRKDLTRADKINLSLLNESKIYQIQLDFNKYKNNASEYSLTDLGLYPFKYLPIVAYTEPQSAAVKAGLKEGDEILKINGQVISNWFQVSKLIKSSPSEKLIFIVKRNDQEITLSIIPDSVTDEDGQIIGKIGIMPTLDNSLIEKNSFIKHYNPLNSLGYAYTACLNLAYNNIAMLGLMLSGNVSWHNLGGPVSIAKASKVAMHQGIKSFVDFLALISLSLAIMNLLPIPVLDGGHILIYAIEWLTGKPMAIDIQRLLFKFGMIFVLGVTFLALYNDFLKLLNL